VDQVTSRRWLALWLGGLAVLVAVAFSGAVGYGWVDYDDTGFVAANPFVNQGLSWRAWRWAFEVHGPSQYHPLTWLSYALDVELFGVEVHALHAVNIALHLGCVWLLFLLLWRATGELWPAGFVAALFAAHPLRVESVVWIAERKDVLSLLLGLCCLHAYLSWVRRRERWRYLLVVLLHMAAVLAKPMLVTLPALMLLLDVWPLRRVDWDRAGWPRDLLRLGVEKLPLAGFSAAALYLTVLAQRAEGALRSLAVVGLVERLGGAARGVLWYVSSSLWPPEQAPLYPWPPFSWPATVAATAVLLAVTVAALALRRSRPWLLCGWLWLGVALVPVIGLVQVGDQWVADRYSYLPTIGLWLALAWEVAARAGTWRKAAATVGLVAVLGYTVAAVRQVTVWRDGPTLLAAGLRSQPDSWVLHNNLAVALRRRGDLDGAEAHFRRAVKCNPGNLVLRLNLGNLVAGRGRVTEARSLIVAAVTSPTATPAEILAAAGVLVRLGADDEARAAVAEALRRDPENLSARYAQSLLTHRSGGDPRDGTRHAPDGRGP
jgi:protein O-mannosyl-transferase